MSRTVPEQVKTGFRLAGGILSFCASLFLLAYGQDAVWSEGHFVSSAWLGWIELSLAAVLIPLTMHLWMQFFPGCVGFGFLKTVVVAIAGRDCLPPHLPFSRLEAAEMALFFGATFVWLAIALAADAVEISDQQKFRIDRRPPGIAVAVFQLLPDELEADVLVDQPQKVMLGNLIVQLEVVEQRF